MSNTTVPDTRNPRGRYPRMIAGYRLVHRIGGGGMGDVFSARHLMTDLTDAVKLIRPEYAIQPLAKSRFRREALAQSLVRSDYVVPIRASGEDQGTPYIILPLLIGHSLERFLLKHPGPSVERAIRVGRDVARALVAIHDSQVVHRDLKPGNIWLDTVTRRCRVFDFGLARVLPPQASALTLYPTVHGTPIYMSPEQAQKIPVDCRSDLFSFGVLLYELSTGIRPFAAPNVLHTLVRVNSIHPPVARVVNPAVPALLSNLIVHLMAKSPNDRPQTARAVVAELDRLDPR